MKVINYLIVCGIFFAPRIVEEAPKDKVLLLPSTCYFINNSAMQEINMVCQKGTREDFFFCVNWTWHLDYDVCNDYDNLWMEEFHFGQVVTDEGFLE